MTPSDAPARAFGSWPLHHREAEVLLALADGLENHEIAAELHLSTETVKSYVKRLLRSLGARNRTHAVALGYHYGILIPKALDVGDV